MTPPPTVSNLLEVHSALIKVYIPWYNYRYFKSKKWAWVGNFCRCVLSKHKAFSCVFLDEGRSDYGEEQNPPELHSIISLELLIKHIPNILNIFKGLLSSGRANSSSSLGHHWSFLEEDDQPMAQRKITFFHQLGYIHSKIPSQNQITAKGQQNPSHSLTQCLQSAVKTGNRLSHLFPKAGGGFWPTRALPAILLIRFLIAGRFLMLFPSEVCFIAIPFSKRLFINETSKMVLVAIYCILLSFFMGKLFPSLPRPGCLAYKDKQSVQCHDKALENISKFRFFNLTDKSSDWQWNVFFSLPFSAKQDIGDKK